MSSAAVAILPFSRFTTPEPLRGEPRQIRELRADRHEAYADEAPYLHQISDFSPGRKLQETRIYEKNGTLSSRQVCGYDSEDRLTEIRSLNQDGSICTIERRQLAPDGTEVSEIRDGNGVVIETITTTRDAAGRVLECSMTDLSTNTNTRSSDLAAHYDAGGQLETFVCVQRFADGSIITLEGLGKGEVISAKYAPREGAPLTPVALPAGSPGLINERVIARDTHGNWTKKELLGLDGRLQAQLFREISYY